MKFSRQGSLSPRNSPPNSGESTRKYQAVNTFTRKIGLVAIFGATVFYLSFVLYQTDSTKNQLQQNGLRPTGGGNYNNHEQCRFYLAESALPRAGLGLFTSVDIGKGEMAQPLIDHCVYVADTPKGTHFHTHAWSKGIFFARWEGKNPWGACEGFATNVNSVPNGKQTSQLRLLYPHNNAGLDRTTSPGAGAITHYYGMTSEALRDVPAGSEITIDYGDRHYSSEDYKRDIPVKQVSWLKQHGMCIDNIRSGPATDPAMGRGAFAAYSLRRGSAVSPAPIQVFRDRQVFAQQEPEALFVNYCFSLGDDSDLLLYPYGPGVTLINHSRQPNVGVRWSKHYMHHAAWLDLPLNVYLDTHDYPGGLLLEYYALRDIKQGEEFFLDYGEDWQEAWDLHKKNWQPVLNDGYVYPQNMSRDKILTRQEQKVNPLPPNIATVCWSWHWSPPDGITTLKWERPELPWPQGMIACDILERRPIITTTTSKTGATKATTVYEYDVRLDLPDGRKLIETSVAGDAIYFVDAMYKSDMHLPNAFRRPMTLPADLIPESWKSWSQTT